MAPGEPVRVALANDYELVLAGVAAMLDPFHDRVVVVDGILVGQAVTDPIDLVLFDTFGRIGDGADGIRELRQTPGIGRVAVYTSTARPPQVSAARDAGASAVLSKSRPAASLVEAIERVHGGEEIIDETGGTQHVPWPGAGRGLTARQSEVVALLLQGLSNAEIADAMFVDVNTVKTHLRHAYKALGVRSRAQAMAMLLGDGDGFTRRRTSTFSQ